MLEETPPPYSYADRLYVAKRTHVWRSPCRRSFAPGVACSQPSNVQWGASLTSDSKDLRQRTSMANSYLPREQNRSGNVIRCPYCVENGNFKAMTSPENGEGHLCTGCGHMVLPRIHYSNVVARSARGSRSLNGVRKWIAVQGVFPDVRSAVRRAFADLPGLRPTGQARRREDR